MKADVSTASQRLISLLRSKPSPSSQCHLTAWTPRTSTLARPSLPPSSRRRTGMCRSHTSPPTTTPPSCPQASSGRIPRLLGQSFDCMWFTVTQSLTQREDVTSGFQSQGRAARPPQQSGRIQHRGRTAAVSRAVFGIGITQSAGIRQGARASLAEVCWAAGVQISQCLLPSLGMLPRSLRRAFDLD